jgi:hypothetical protein
MRMKGMNKKEAYQIALKSLKEERFLSKLNNGAYKILFPSSIALEIEAYKNVEILGYGFLFELLNQILEKEIGSYIDGESRLYYDFMTDGIMFEFRLKEGMESGFLSKIGHVEGSDSLRRLKRRFTPL